MEPIFQGQDGVRGPADSLCLIHELTGDHIFLLTSLSKGRLKKYFKINENNPTYQNVRDAVKTVLGGKFTAVNTYLRKEISDHEPNISV